MPIKLAKRIVGDGHPCFITFEAGPTHSGLASALELVEQAAMANCDAIKFQVLQVDRLVADKKQLFEYQVLLDRDTGATQTVSEPLYDILKRRELTAAEWRIVKKKADALGLCFFATVSFQEDVDLLADIGAESVKIASSDINHIPLIKAAARTGMCVQIDTGSSTIGEVENAVDAIVNEGNNNIVIHQCPSGYPARLPSIQLRMIQTLKQMFPFPVAFSDHTPGWEMDIAAVALGANMVEKTITLNRCSPSVEHIFSLEGSELSAFVRIIRDLEIALGDTRRSFGAEEYRKRLGTRRSAFLNCSKLAGEKISSGDIEFRRPGFGIPPTEMERIVSLKVSRDLPAGTCLEWTDLKP